MKKLLKAVNNLEKIYERLDNLIRVALFKAVRAGEGLGQTQERAVHFNEDEYDRIAYNDAVNRRFEFYYQEVRKFLELFFHEQYGIRARNAQELFSLCRQKEFISDVELDECLSLINFVRTIHKPRNKIGDSILTEQLLCYTVTMNDLSTQLAAQVKSLPFDVLKQQESVYGVRSAVRI